MKRILTLLIAAICTVGLWAEEFTIGELTFRTISATEVELYRAKDDITSAYLSSTITYKGKTYRLTSIGDGAFYYCTNLTSITIPNSVTNIGDYAFDGCDGLASITIPNSVTSIGSNAFYGCSSLTSITIPNSVTSIGNRAFLGCTGLTSVTIGNSVTSIGERAFWDCTSLTTVTIPNSVTTIGNGAFSGCSALTSVTIPNSVTSIGDGAFAWCNSLTSITIPNSVTRIGYGAFNSATNVTKMRNASQYYWGENLFNDYSHYIYANEILFVDTYEEYFSMLDEFYPIQLSKHATEYDIYKASLIQRDSLLAFECFDGCTPLLFACEALRNRFTKFTNDKLSDIYRQTNYYSSEVDTAFKRYMGTMDDVADYVVVIDRMSILGRLENVQFKAYLEECHLNSLLETLFYSEVDVPNHMTVTDEMIQSAFDMLREHHINYYTSYYAEDDVGFVSLTTRLDLINQDQAAWDDWMQARKVHESQLVGVEKQVYSTVTNNIKWEKLGLLEQMYELFPY